MLVKKQEEGNALGDGERRGKVKSVRLSIGITNVDKQMRARELDMMQRRKGTILCVRTGGVAGVSHARCIGARIQLCYHCVEREGNGEGLILKEVQANKVVDLKSVSDRVMSVKLEMKCK